MLPEPERRVRWQWPKLHRATDHSHIIANGIADRIPNATDQRPYQHADERAIAGAYAAANTSAHHLIADARPDWVANLIADTCANLCANVRVAHQFSEPLPQRSRPDLRNLRPKRRSHGLDGGA